MPVRAENDVLPWAAWWAEDMWIGFSDCKLTSNAATPGDSATLMPSVFDFKQARKWHSNSKGLANLDARASLFRGFRKMLLCDPKFREPKYRHHHNFHFFLPLTSVKKFINCSYNPRKVRIEKCEANHKILFFDGRFGIDWYRYVNLCRMTMNDA